MIVPITIYFYRKKSRIQEILILLACEVSSTNVIKIKNKLERKKYQKNIKKINVMCHVSLVTFHVSPVTYRVSPVTCHISLTSIAIAKHPPPANSPSMLSRVNHESPKPEFFEKRKKIIKKTN